MARQKATQPSNLVHPKTLVLCEGKTEETYFHALKQEFRHTGLLIPHSKYNTPRQLVEEAVYLKKEASKESAPFAKIFVVFDHDPHSPIHEAFDMAARNDIRIAYSNPCFELWYLLHFIPFSTSSFSSCEHVIRALKQYIPEYRKGQNYGHLLIEKTDTALKNSTGLIKHWQQIGNGNIQTYNPYCDINRLVENLRTIE